MCVSLICTPSYELIETNVSAGEFRGVVLLSTGHYAMKYGEFGFDEDKNKLDVHDRCIFYTYIYIYVYGKTYAEFIERNVGIRCAVYYTRRWLASKFAAVMSRRGKTERASPNRRAGSA